MQLRLIYIDDGVVRALAEDALFEKSYGVRLDEYGDLVRSVVTAGEDLRHRLSAPPEWGGYIAVDPRTLTVVGCCGFRGAPDYIHRVEIAYVTFPRFERRGIATAMARALVDIARERSVDPIAHTMPEPGASTRILERLGFVRVATVIVDPEDGPVWRWEPAPV